MSGEVRKSHKLSGVCYDIRGQVFSEARRLEEEGYRILKLNIGNTAPFGLDAPDELFHDVIVNLRDAQGYCDSKGLFSARKAVMQKTQRQHIPGVEVDDVYIGNGVSELIVMSMQALLNDGDEILIPAPDYPLWTAAVNLSGGTAVHYLCDEASEWYPDLDDIQKKITPRTKGIVVINPNNPTGSVYPREILEKIHDIAAEHDLLVFADEIYDQITYDGTEHVPMASLCDDLVCLSFSGLSKVYRAPGFRAGWMVLSGRTSRARDYREGLDILANMRLCSNVPSQFAIQAALGGYQSVRDLVLPAGRLGRQRDVAHQMLNAIPGVSCTLPKGALYLFPRLDQKKFRIKDDQKLVLDLLSEEKMLLVQGTGFNWPKPDHLRIVFLPNVLELTDAMQRLTRFLDRYSQ
ncbi:MAG: pyridoxal phosphate-dependent aminotransferase [Spirochaetota bacterium]